MYPSCLQAVCVCWKVQSSLHTLLQPEPGLYTCRMRRAEVRRTGGRGEMKRNWSRIFNPCFHLKARQVSGFALPGYVPLTVNSDTQVTSSSPPVQSSCPSQALSIGINFTDLLQKKYLLSISFLTERRATHWTGHKLKMHLDKQHTVFTGLSHIKAACAE